MSTAALETGRDRDRTDIGGLRNRGVFAGGVGGAAMAGFLLAAGEPSIRRALALESRQHHAEHVEQMFSRGVQVLGGVCAAMLYGVLLGAIFAVAFAVVRHR